MTTLTYTKLYDSDFYAWTERQAELLRAEEFEAVDWDNLIEEIMAMGAAQRRELTSRLQVLHDLFRNDWTVIGSFALCYTLLPAIAWLANGVVDVSKLVRHTVPMADFAPAFHAFAAGQTLKVHVQM